MGLFGKLCSAVGNAVSSVVSSAVSVVRSTVSAVSSAVSYVARATVETVRKVDRVMFGTPYKDEYNRLYKDLQELQQRQRREIEDLKSEYESRLRRLDSNISDGERSLRDLESRNRKIIRELESSIEKQKAENEKKIKSLEKDHQDKMKNMKEKNLDERKKLDKEFTEEMEKLRKQDEEDINEKLHNIEKERERMNSETADAEKKLDNVVKERLKVIEDHSAQMENLRVHNFEVEKAEKEQLHVLKKQHLEAQREHIKEVTATQVDELNKQAEFLGISYEQKWGKRLLGHFDGMIQAALTSHATIHDLTDNLGEVDGDFSEDSFAAEMSKELLKDHEENVRNVKEISKFLRSQINDFPDIEPNLKEGLTEAVVTYARNQDSIAHVPSQLKLALKNGDSGRVEKLRGDLIEHKKDLLTIVTSMQLVRTFDKDTLLQILENPEMLAIQNDAISEHE